MKLFLAILSCNVKSTEQEHQAKDRGMKCVTQVRLVNASVFIIVLFGAFGKAKRKNVNAFEMWCWR